MWLWLRFRFQVGQKPPLKWFLQLKVRQKGCYGRVDGSTSHCKTRSLPIRAQGVDFVVIGEPEVTVSELVDALAAGKQDFEGIDGLGFKENGKATNHAQTRIYQRLRFPAFPSQAPASHGTLQRSRQRKPAQRRNKQAMDHHYHYQRLPLQLRLLLGLHTLGQNLASKKPKERG